MAEQERSELLPCPFCGGDASQEWSRDATGEFSYIVCTECSGQADHRQVWNTRAPTPDAVNADKALLKALLLARSWIRHSEECSIHTPTATEDGFCAKCSCAYAERIAVIDAAALATPAPDKALAVIYVSAGQLAAVVDDHDGGTYLPVRRSPLGNFTTPLYTSASSDKAVMREALEYYAAGIGFSEIEDGGQVARTALEALTTPAPDKALMPESAELRVAIQRGLLAALSDTYDCTRVWSARSYGTMGEDDFEPVLNRLDDLIDTIVAEIAATPTPVEEPEKGAAGDRIKYDAAAVEAVQRLLERGKAYIDPQGYLTLIPADSDVDIILDTVLLAATNAGQVEASMRAALRDIAEAEAIPNDAVAFVWCRDVARTALKANGDAS